MFSLLRRGSVGRGMTLIEVVVAVTLSVVVTGILLGIFLQTRSASARGQEQVAMLSHARQIGAEVRSILHAAVPPASLDTGETTLTLSFQPSICALISARDFDGEDFYLTTIRSRVDQDTRQGTVEHLGGVLDAGRTRVVRESRRILGTPDPDGEFSSTIHFEYANTVEQAMERRPFRDSLDPGEYPRVIRFRIRVERRFPDGSINENIRPVEYVSAVKLL